MKKFPIPPYLKVAAIMTVYVVLVLFIRNWIVGDQIYNFLLRNLSAGFLPLLIAFLLKEFNDKFSNVFFWIGSVLWVLFYPNAPYMISDLIHGDMDNVIIIPDTLVIFSIALVSIFYGLLSLKIMYTLFTKRSGKRLANIAITISLLLSCLGFYMGRILLFFSIDALKNPIHVIKEVWAHLFPIGENIYTYELMILFGGIQVMLLIMMKDINDIESGLKITKAEPPA